ncbi:hypothetical protein [Marinobacter sp. F4206]|uniref:hypothetical protein n=1 Tax=Marinobacter sp. F4206 TaxID=2861777 RepID=UPI001C5E4E3A|nr:hypothetical protein [Marinobacter sp. F4206]MBW4934483.1 hypothetical protein [Marinobacter sp. F4206]
MIRSLPRGIAVASMLVFLVGCSNPETPREVTEAFWHSVTENDADEVAELSTLADPSQFDGFGTDWQTISIDWGKIVIDGSRATVETRFLSADNDDRKKVLTYLERREGDWTVDYELTQRAVTSRSMFDDVIGTLSDLSERLSQSINRSSDSVDERLEELASELEALSSEAEQRSREALEEYGEKLQKHIEELTESIEEALKGEPDASPRDRGLLEASRQDLNRQRERLDEPDLQAFAESGRAVTQTRFRLTELDQARFGEYRSDWQDWIEEIEDDLSRLMDEVAAGRS